MKRIIWAAQNRRHKIISVWWPSLGGLSFKTWKSIYSDVHYITKHYIEV